MLKAVYFFERAAEIPGLFDGLFGGLFRWKAVPATVQIAWLSLLSLSVALTVRKPTSRLLPVFGIGLFSLGALLACQPWDELFVHLRHARHWAESGVFSFNVLSRIEGTADFLPYFLIGEIHRWWGLPLFDLALLQSWLGGGLLIAAVVALARLEIPTEHARTRAAVLILACVFPAFVYNAAQGFAASLFTAVWLWAIYFLRTHATAWCPLGLLAMLPLIRPEGIWFGFVTLLATQTPRVALRRFALVALPFVALCLVRKMYFGSALPVPVTYKSAFGSLFFLSLGLRNILSDALASYALPLLLIGWNSQTKKWILIAGAAIAPYYLSGGDWFPPHWARYALPLTAIAFVSAAQNARKSSAWMLLLFLGPLVWPQGGVRRMATDILAPRKTLAKVESRHSGHARLQNLSQLGMALRESSEPHWRIGSSEIATLMYFAQREAVDFLGVANPTVAGFPLRTPHQWLAKQPRSALPYSIFRRIDPTYLDTQKPEILYLFDFSVRDLAQDMQVAELSPKSLGVLVRRWERKFQGLISPLYGPLSRVVDLGYESVVLRSGEDFANLYLVRSDVLEQHLTTLSRLGYSGHKVELD